MGEHDRHVLRSWALIAAYLKVAERTAQRWHEQYGLPVRQGPGDKGQVRADRDQLDRWLSAWGPALKRDEHVP